MPLIIAIWHQTCSSDTAEGQIPRQDEILQCKQAHKLMISEVQQFKFTCCKSNLNVKYGNNHFFCLFGGKEEFPAMSASRASLMQAGMYTMMR